MIWQFWEEDRQELPPVCMPRASVSKPFLLPKTLRVRVLSQPIFKNGFSITTDKSSFEAKTILAATGSHRRKLEIPGAQEYENKGITYCASCDGPVFSGMD